MIVRDSRIFVLVPGCQRKLVSVYDNLVETHGNVQDLKENKNFVAAKVLDEAKSQFPKSAELHVLSIVITFVDFKNNFEVNFQ